MIASWGLAAKSLCGPQQGAVFASASAAVLAYAFYSRTKIAESLNDYDGCWMDIDNPDDIHVIRDGYIRWYNSLESGGWSRAVLHDENEGDNEIHTDYGDNALIAQIKMPSPSMMTGLSDTAKEQLVNLEWKKGPKGVSCTWTRCNPERATLRSIKVLSMLGSATDVHFRWMVLHGDLLWLCCAPPMDAEHLHKMADTVVEVVGALLTFSTKNSMTLTRLDPHGPGSVRLEFESAELLDSWAAEVQQTINKTRVNESLRKLMSDQGASDPEGVAPKRSSRRARFWDETQAAPSAGDAEAPSTGRGSRRGSRWSVLRSAFWGSQQEPEPQGNSEAEESSGSPTTSGTPDSAGTPQTPQAGLPAQFSRRVSLAESEAQVMSPSAAEVPVPSLTRKGSAASQRISFGDFEKTASTEEGSPIREPSVSQAPPTQHPHILFATNSHDVRTPAVSRLLPSPTATSSAGSPSSEIWRPSHENLKQSAMTEDVSLVQKVNTSGLLQATTPTRRPNVLSTTALQETWSSGASRSSVATLSVSHTALPSHALTSPAARDTGQLRSPSRLSSLRDTSPRAASPHRSSLSGTSPRICAGIPGSMHARSVDAPETLRGYEDLGESAEMYADLLARPVLPSSPGLTRLTHHLAKLERDANAVSQTLQTQRPPMDDAHAASFLQPTKELDMFEQQATALPAMEHRYSPQPGTISRRSAPDILPSGNAVPGGHLNSSCLAGQCRSTRDWMQAR